MSENPAVVDVQPGEVASADASNVPEPPPETLATFSTPSAISAGVVDERPFKVVSDFAPAGDQPEAIRHLSEGIERGELFQTLLGITGSGKSATVAWILERVQKPTLILAPNKSLAAQLAQEMREQQLRETPFKVDHFAAIYRCMRDGIVTHPYAVTGENVEELLNLTFVFVCIDDPAGKEPIIDALIAHGIDFVDVGMGIELLDGMLTGIVRTTLVTGDKHDHVGDRISTADGGDGGDYRSNIQIAELNARNASDAVIRWKKLRGVYADLGGEHFTAFTITTNNVINDDRDVGPGAVLRCA